MIMGLPFSIHLRAPFDPVRAESTIAAVWAELRRTDEIFSTYLVDSDINRLNRGELALADADPLVTEMLDLAAAAAWVTRGAFDIHGSGRLDPSGLVKGWAAERAARRLTDLDADFYLNAGGDILVQTGEGDVPWRVGIEHPDNPAALMAVLAMSSGAVATSSSAHRGVHIWGPAGRPARGLRQVTILGPTLLWADILATAVFAVGSAEPDTSRWPADFHALLVDDRGQLSAHAEAISAMAPEVPTPPIRRHLPPSPRSAGAQRGQEMAAPNR